jgi:hypothetical protein
MFFLDFVFYIYYLVSVGLTRYGDIPVFSACCFMAFAIGCNSLVLLNLFNIDGKQNGWLWLLLGFILLLTVLLYWLYNKRSERVLNWFKNAKIIWHFAAFFWAVIFSSWGWFVYRYVLK